MKKIILMLMLGALATASQADILVDFYTNNNWTAANVNNQGLTPSGIRYVPFSMSSVRSPATGYAGPIMFGGATATVSMTTWVLANSTPDYFSAGGNSTGIGSKAWAVYMFTNQTAASITQVVYNTRIGGSGASQSNLLRIVVRKTDGSFYISEQRGRPSVGNLTNSNPSALAWYNYDPTSSIVDIGSQVTGFELSNVNAIGEWIYNEHTSGVLAGVNASTQVFQAWGTIPEPATVGMLGLGALITVLIRRVKS